ncbi:MAG: DUF1700 domain-containing protein [Bacillota bacterium]|nr:DUF1700 domain-containing protein [Bacillota bacterium]
MNRNEFMYSLRNSLSAFPEKEREEIIYDYEEHFAVALQSGKTEDEVCRELGDPVNIGKQYKINSSIERASSNPTAGNILRAIVASLSLGLLNVIFVLGPFIAVASVLLSLLISGVAVAFSGIASTVAILINGIFPQLIPFFTVTPWITGMLFAIALTCAGMLICMFMSSLIKVFFKGTLKYLKMNFNIITGRR